MTYDVIVVGGGITGLTAAQTLTKLGRKVGLFEASDNLGGRLVSVQNSQGESINVGGNTIQAENYIDSPLIPIIKNHKIKTKKLNPLQAEAFDSFGEKIDLTKLHEKLLPEYNKTLMMIQEGKVAQIAEQIQNKKTGINNYPVLSKLLLFDEHPIHEKDSLSYWARKFIIASIEQHTGASVDKSTLLEFMQNDESFSEKEVILLPATKIIDALYFDANITGNLTMHMNSVLHKLRCLQDNMQDSKQNNMRDNMQNNNGPNFELIFKNGKRYKTAAVILALPFAILKSGKIEFEPELSIEKQRAFNHFGISHVNSVFLEFDEIFWDKNVHFIYPNGEKIEDWPQYLNLAAFTDKKFPGLVIQYYGKRAMFGKKRDQEIVDDVLKPLERVYGDKIGTLKSFYITRFDTDPNILGGSLYYSKNTKPEDLEALLEQEFPGLYFAGDYLHPKNHNTLEAASFSGLEAAMQADSFLNYRMRLQSYHKKRLEK